MFYQGDENDPELPYRDIAKFNIVQVAGTLNTIYLDIRLSYHNKDTVRGKVIRTVLWHIV